MAFEMIWRDAIPPQQGGYPGFNPRTLKDKGLSIEYDQAVVMRDGKKIYVDSFRPDREGRFPVIIAWGPYGKHGRLFNGDMVNCGQEHQVFSRHAIYEGPDPAYWCKNGYVVLNPDPRGLWNSEGDVSLMSRQEAEDCYDLIEWAGTQSWSNGKVGMLGVSYLAWTQWRVASLNPPHLAAICPWEGVSDFYREFAFHGGIPETWFYPIFQVNCSFSRGRVENLLELQKKHPLYDEYWESKNADLSKITVPALITASWTDHGLHNRGTFEGFKKIASREKYFFVHGRKKWQNFFEPVSVERQRQFFNRFLKGIANEVKNWPAVTLEIRERYYVGKTRTEREFPIARTRYTPLYLDAARGRLTDAPGDVKSHISYGVEDINDKTQNARFEYEFEQDTELTGYMKLKLWVEARGSDDMDLFVAVEKIDRAGYIVQFPYFGNHDDGGVALGWLRVSHRELDEAKSSAFQPVHKHRQEIKLQAGEIVPVEIELWPSGTLFEKGEKLRLIVQGSDIHAHPEGGHTMQHRATVNKGLHVIYSGGRYDSHLLVPVIPEQ
ncbi:MAG TPA: CocE/NonD family hydrolase [Dehalococcoidales bacterium]|nr:CocE/NonD family hydrolase [Dehalococcoidales bacterium]